MNMKLLMLLIIGIWIGMLIGISFVEAPLKFRAPNITIPLGLGIGKLVFSALNKFEIVFSILLAGWLYFNYNRLEFFPLVALGSIITIVVIQSIWLLPALSLRADQHIAGQQVANSPLHFYYVAMECLKVGLLIIGYVKIYKSTGYSG